MDFAGGADTLGGVAAIGAGDSAVAPCPLSAPWPTALLCGKIYGIDEKRIFPALAEIYPYESNRSTEEDIP